jgi:UDP-N-acetylglucosamine 2-epimerase (non-hydrolysing)
MATAPMRICITLGTRPEAIKLAPVIQAFRQAEGFATQVVLDRAAPGNGHPGDGPCLT